MSSTTTQIEFSNALQHTYDSNYIEITGGQGKLKSQVLSSEILFANYDTDGDLTSKRGSKTLTLAGTDNTGQVASGILSFPNQDGSYGRYNSITNIVDDFALRFKAISNISTASLGTSHDFARLKSNVDNSEIIWRFQNQGGGIARIYIKIIDSSGATIDDYILGTAALAVGSFANLAVSNDDDGNLLFFFQGELVKTQASPTFDFTDCFLEFGNATFATANYDNVQLFNANVITTNYAFPFPEPTTYATTAQLIRTPLPLPMNAWSFFGDNTEELNGNTVKHHIFRNGIRYWYNTSTLAWEIVDTGSELSTQTNSDTDINSNLSDFPLSLEISTSIEIGTYLKSSDGYSTPTIDYLKFIFDLFVKPDELSKCSVNGRVVDDGGNPISGATIEFSSEDHYSSDSFVGPNVSTTTDSNGIWNLSIVETQSTGTTVNCKITYTENGEEKSFVYEDLIIENVASKKLSQIIIDSAA